MKRLLALLLLLSSAALHAQQLDWTNAVNVPNTVTNSSFEACPNNTQLPNCGPWQEGPGFQPGTWTSNFGSREYVFSYVPGLLFQDIDLTQYDTNLFNFTFSFALNNSCRNSIGGSCTNINGPIDEFSAKIKFYDANGLNNEFTFLSGTPSTANIVCDLEILGLCLGGYSAQDQWQQFGWYSHVQSDSLFTSARIEFTGRDVGFWGGVYGPRLDNVNLTINYMPPPLPTSGGLAGMNVSAPGSDYIFIYRGNDPVLFSQLAIKGEDIVGWTAVSTSGEALGITQVTQPDPDYLFLYTDGIPTSGTYYSFQEQPPTVDCVLSPFDPTCIIDTLGIDDGTVDYTDPEQVLASLEDDTTDITDTGADDGSDDGTEVIEEEEEVLVADEEVTDEEVSLEEMLQEEETTDEEEAVLVADEETETVSEPAVVATYRELTDEEKAAILADAISKNTLEGALAIASDATSLASNAASTTTTVTESSSSRFSILASASTSAIEQEAASIEIKVEETKVESNESSSAAIDVLETGRQLGKEALAATLAATEQSANESIAQAESIAASSSETQTSATTTAETTSSFVSEEISVAQTAQEKLEETVVASSQVKEETTTTETVVEDTSSTTVVVAKTEETEEKKEVQVAQEEVTNATIETETQVVAVAEASTETESSTVVVENTTEQTVEEERTEMVVSNDVQSIEQTGTFAELMQLDIKPVIEEKTDGDFEFVQQLAVASNEQKQEETNNSGFSEDEKVTIANDPALANAFNLAPNITNLEVAGVLNNKQEEKSDAEKRADEVVAANAKEQEEINKNYMDADQSGIVAAMGADTDVSAYRTAMIRDNNIWYKPEDIYKNIVYKDNVRGAYFLEKGNTDTYKKMVEEQYK